MSKISKSPDRHTFQKKNYINRQKENKQPLNQKYIDMYDEFIEQEKTKFSDPKTRINNMEYDLLTTDWILEKSRNSETYAQNLYAAMCNNEFIKREMWPILKEEKWSCSWRYSGGIIADMRQEGDYINWYCSGIRNTTIGDEESKFWNDKKYVPEGCITEEIEKDLSKLGWIVAAGGDWEKFINQG